ncbi:MAG: DUF411 domain-containing protein [Alphaproteobacteria bacterium]
MRAVLFALLLVLAPAAFAGTAVTVYKDPLCDCCGAYADYLRGHGFDVTVVETEDMAAVHARAGTPEGFEGCHMAMIEGYAVEGHVPVGAIEKLLDERPAITGISLPGMPEGSPGMGGDKGEPFVVHGFGDGSSPRAYAIE